MVKMTGVSEISGVNEYKYVAGGEWRSAGGNKLFDGNQPYDRTLYARVAAGRKSDAKIAIDAAAKAFPAWARTTPAERAKLFLAAARIAERRRDEVCELLAHEGGCTVPFAAFQQGFVLAALEHAASWVYQPTGEVLASNEPGTHS